MLYHSEFKIHNVSQAQSNQLVLQISLFMSSSRMFRNIVPILLD